MKDHFQITVYGDVFEKFKKHCEAEGYKIKSLASIILEDYLKKQKKGVKK